MAWGSLVFVVFIYSFFILAEGLASPDWKIQRSFLPGMDHGFYGGLCNCWAGWALIRRFIIRPAVLKGDRLLKR